MFKNKIKKFLFSLFALPLLASYSVFFIDTNKNSVVNVSNNYKSSISDTSIEFEDSFPVAEQSIKSLSDYVVSYEDNNISPIDVNNAVIGMTRDYTTLTYTTYSGLLLWSSNLTKNPLIKQYYSTYLKINNIGAYQISYYTYQKSTGLLFVLFGDKTKVNQVVFAIDIYTGNINIPNNAFLKDNQIITKVADGSSFIFFNQSNEVIVTSGGTKENVDKTTKIFKYEVKTTGFYDKKLSINIPTAYTSSEGENNDYLLGIYPGKNGINYGYFLYCVPNSKKFQFSLYESNTDPVRKENNSSYNYYFYPLNDDLTRAGNFYVVSIANSGYRWGYVGKESEYPKFDDIYKRVFQLENASNPNQTYLFALQDSYWKFYDSYTLLSANGTKFSAQSSRGFGNANIIVQKNDFSNIENGKITLDSWKFDSFGYDAESNLLYFSFGAPISEDTKTTGYLCKMGYYNFSASTNLVFTASSFEKENNIYNLYSVGFESYTSQDKYYMVKEPQNSAPLWLSRNNNELIYNPTTNSTINFSELSVENQNLIQQIETNKLFKEKMPNSITQSDLKNLLSSLNTSNINDSIQISKVSSDNQSGIITLKVEINHTNNFGDGVQNGNVNYLFQVNIYGYSMQKDFIFRFITTDMVNMGFNDKINKINEIKEVTEPSAITKAQIKSYFLNVNILDKDNSVLVINDDWITMIPNDDLGNLSVEINLPSDKFPAGFPRDSLSINAVYKDFFVHVDPLPPDSDHSGSTNPSFVINSDDGEKIGIIASGVVGVTLIFAILFSFLFWKHRKQTKNLNNELTIKK